MPQYDILEIFTVPRHICETQLPVLKQAHMASEVIILPGAVPKQFGQYYCCPHWENELPYGSLQ